MPIEWMDGGGDDRPPPEPRPGAAAPRRAPVPFNHDLLRLALEGCNPGGFRNLAIANRAGPSSPPAGRPRAFALDPGALLSTSGGAASPGSTPDVIFCLNPRFSTDGVAVPGWFGAALDACRGAGGADLETLTAAVSRARPDGGPPAEAWVARLVPALWSAGILCDAAG